MDRMTSDGEVVTLSPAACSVLVQPRATADGARCGGGGTGHSGSAPFASWAACGSTTRMNAPHIPSASSPAPAAAVSSATRHAIESAACQEGVAEALDCRERPGQEGTRTGGVVRRRRRIGREGGGLLEQAYSVAFCGPVLFVTERDGSAEGGCPPVRCDSAPGVAGRRCLPAQPLCTAYGRKRRHRRLLRLLRLLLLQQLLLLLLPPCAVPSVALSGRHPRLPRAHHSRRLGRALKCTTS
eukprot:246434-Chlamydomonas_euryale.AAC.3